MSDTPRTDEFIAESCAWPPVPIRLWPDFARQLERELNGANQRIQRLEEALGLVLKMQNDWLEMQDNGYAGAYYAFVKGNDSEWEEIIKAKEDKP